MWRKVIMNYLGIKEVKDKYRAVRIRKNLSILYAFLGWNCFGVIFYILIKDKIPIDKTERRQAYKNLTGVPDNVHVYQFSGLKFIKEFDVTNNAENEKETTEIEKTTVKVNEH